MITNAFVLSPASKGEFLASTIHNIGKQEDQAIQKLSGISPDWSSAKKLLAILSTSAPALFPLLLVIVLCIELDCVSVIRHITE